MQQLARAKLIFLHFMLSRSQSLCKRSFDLIIATPLFLLFLPLIFLLFVLASISTKSPGLFLQIRVGQYAVPFHIIKIKTMIDVSSPNVSTVTTVSEPRITSFGRFLRRYKLDELPQLLNVVIGNMSLVGPRPDVPGFADKLDGEDRAILSLKPGITGPSSLVFADEEFLLSRQADPVNYNRTVIWPKKVSINRQYLSSWTLLLDLRILARTVFAALC